MRFTLRCITAVTFPTVMVSAARSQRTPVQSAATWPRAAMKTRAKAAKAAALTPTAMNPVTAVGVKAAAFAAFARVFMAALGHVAHPHVERDEGDLEPEADEQKGDAEEPEGAEPALPDRPRDHVEAGAARGAVEEGDPVEEETAREGAEEKVLERRLGRADLAAEQPG